MGSHIRFVPNSILTSGDFVDRQNCVFGAADSPLPRQPKQFANRRWVWGLPDVRRGQARAERSRMSKSTLDSKKLAKAMNRAAPPIRLTTRDCAKPRSIARAARSAGDLPSNLLFG